MSRPRSLSLSLSPSCSSLALPTGGCCRAARVWVRGLPVEGNGWVGGWVGGGLFVMGISIRARCIASPHPIHVPSSSTLCGLWGKGEGG